MSRFHPCLLLLFALVASSTLAQTEGYDPFRSFDKENKVLTLSNGQFEEFHDQDSIVLIGSAIFNTRTMKVVGIVGYDTTYSEATLEPEVQSRWLSPDPLAASFPNMSPYNFVNNSPLILIDPDGRDTLLINNLSGKVLDTKAGGDDVVFSTNKKRGTNKAWKKSNQLFHQLEISGQNGAAPTKKGDPVIWSKLSDQTDNFEPFLDYVTLQFMLHGLEIDDQEKTKTASYMEKVEFMNKRFADEAVYDIKLKNQFHVGRIGEWSWYNGKLTRYDDYGNILYGSAGKALGLSKITLTTAAEINQWTKFGSDKGRDVHQINNGIKNFKEFDKDLPVVKP